MADQTAFVFLTDGQSTSRAVRSQAATWAHRRAARKSKPSHNPKRLLRIEPKPSEKSVSNTTREEEAADEVNPARPEDILFRQFEAYRVSRLIPDQDPLVRLHGSFTARWAALVGGAGQQWLVTDALLCNDELLRDGLRMLAIGLCLPGPELAYRRWYKNILARFQDRLSNHQGFDLMNTLAVTIVLSYHELVVCNNPTAWVMHLNGMGRIIQMLGPLAFTSRPALHAFKWYRRFGLSLDLIRRRPSFMALPEWTNLPWAHENRPKEVIDKVMDALVRTPGMIAVADQCRTGSVPPSALHQQIAAFKNDMDNLQIELIALAASQAIADFNDLVCALIHGSIIDFELAQAVVLFLTSWLLVSRLVPAHSRLPPARPAILVKYVMDIAQRFVAHAKDGEGFLAWALPIRVALLTPLDQIPSEFYTFCNQADERYSVKVLSHTVEASQKMMK